VSDEGFREIQLNGKQLVFLFMAATVVSVVIFLCGVFVGRGVRGAGTAIETVSTEVAPDSGATAVPESAAQQAGSVASSGPAGNPAPAAEDLSYAERLLKETPPAETLKVAPRPAAVAPPPPPPPPPAAAPPTPTKQQAATQAPPQVVPPPAVRVEPAKAPVVAATASEPSGPGFAVQVAAYRDRREAQTLATQLIAKGYPAFVMDPVKGAPTAMFRVRVGKYKTLKDAEAVSARLQSAEQFKPWIAR